MKHLVFLLEEPSAKAMLEGLLPRLIPFDNVCVRYIIFEGKQDLEKQIEKRLKGWLLPNSIFIVLRDQDSGDCKEIKQNLITKCTNAGKPDSLVRIACHELESFYLGDLQAVEKAFDLKGLSKHQKNKKYRNPDTLANPSQDLISLTKNAYQKVSGSHAIGKHLSTISNSSYSYHVLINGIQKKLGEFNENSV